MRHSSRLVRRKPVARASRLLVWLLLAASCGTTARAQVVLERVLTDQTLRRPVHLAPIPDGSGDLVVVEQDGVLWRFAPTDRRARPFMDIRARVNASGNEEGMLSIAFHPQFPRNGAFLLYYSAADPRRSVLARFRTLPGQSAGDPASEQIVLEVPQPYANHNGGQIAFGPDGMLYVGLGDGGLAGDIHGYAQDRRELLGSILRIDIDREQDGRPYAVPPDNPFVGGRDGSRTEIWAYGLRNPWRFSFDRRTGALIAADVGQGSLEEVDLIAKGGNYGWNRMEGTRCYGLVLTCRKGDLIEPLTEYGRDQGKSITGGFVYRGTALPPLVGRYLFGDYVSGRIWSIPVFGRGVRPPTLLLESGLNISSFGEDESGEIYVLDHGQGRVFRVSPAP